jgi:putative DNA primase/helicase
MSAPDLAAHAETIARALLGEPNEDLSTKSTLRYGSKGSLAISIAGTKAGGWFDHETKTGGGPLDLIRREKGINGAEAFDWLRSIGIGDEPKPTGARYTVTGRWIYRDRDGQPVYRVVRRDCPGKPKKFHQERHDPATGSYKGEKGCMKGVRLLPYRLPEWVDEDAPLLIPEGERKVDALFDLGFLASCNTGGSGKFSPGFAPYFADRDVVLLPDNDAAGRDHVRKVAAILEPVATSLKVVELPGLPPKGDVVDWRAAGGTKEQLAALIEAAPAAKDWLAGQPELESEPEPASTVQGSFKITDDGVFRLVENKDGDREWLWIASRIEVAAETRNAGGESWGRLLRIPDRDGIEHRWAMPMGMLAGDGVTYRERLLSLGAELAPGKGSREGLHTYLTVWRPAARARCVESTGWHGQTFVLPDRVYGSAGEEVFLQAPGAAPQYDLAGSLAGWQTDVAALAVGNSRLAFAISTALAAALLYPAQEESGGVHVYGASSTGKTTIGLCAASVWGIPKRSWRTTANAAEALARGSCDALLLLDEISQAEPWVVDAMAYMLGNEGGKARMRRDATARETLTWRTLFLSTGEIGLMAKLVEIGRRPRAGQSMRLIEIPSDAGAGLGCFEMLHGHRNGDALARHLKLAADQNKGHAARAFVERIAAEFTEVGEVVAEYRRRWLAPENGTDSQVLRAAGRFALIAAAGELAQEWGIVPWTAGEAQKAAQTCFKAWLATRGGTEPQEIIEGLAQVRLFIEEHGNDRFERAWDIRRDREGNEIPERVTRRAGFRRQVGEGEEAPWEYYVLPEAWRREACKGFDHVALARAMVAKGWLAPGEGNNLAARARVPRHGLIRAYHVLPAFLEAD